VTSRYRGPEWRFVVHLHLIRFLRVTLKVITFRRTVLAVVVVPLLVYIFGQVTHDAIVIDPFTVPKNFEEIGLTPEVIANRIGDALRQIETKVKTRNKKDSLTLLRDYNANPDVEIPGTNIGLKAIVEIIRNVFGIYPKHVSGDVVVSVNTPTQASVTVYITQGRGRSPAVSLVAPATDIDLLAKRTAEIVLGQINPYILACYRYDQHNFVEAAKIAIQMTKDPSMDRIHRAAAVSFLGNVLDVDGKYDEALTKYQEAVHLDPKSANAYLNWGYVLYKKKKYNEAVTKYQKAIDLDPKFALAYNNWGAVLSDQERYDEAVTKYQKAIDLDPTDPVSYLNWAKILYDRNKYNEAMTMYEQASDLDPTNPNTYIYWGHILYDQERYDEAVAKIQKAIDVDPNFADAYLEIGRVLMAQERYTEAIVQYQKAIDLDPKSSSAYNNWGAVLERQKRYADALIKYRKAIELDPLDEVAKNNLVLLMEDQSRHKKVK
jgi:tetratricopeptide (TPR) repeat protein